MLTVTRDDPADHRHRLLPRPLWSDRSLEGRSFKSALSDSLFREQYLDAVAGIVAEQEAAGLDIVPWYRARHAQEAAAASRITGSLFLGLVDAAEHAKQRYFIIKPRETTFRSFADAPRRLELFTHRDLALDWNT